MRQQHGLDAAHVQPHAVIEVIRRGLDDLLTGLGQRIGRETIGLVAAGGDQDVFRLHRAAVAAVDVARETGTQRRNALDIGIARGLRRSDDITQMIGQRRRGRIAGRGLAQIDQRLVVGKAATGNPRNRLRDRRLADRGQQWVDAEVHDFRSARSTYKSSASGFASASLFFTALPWTVSRTASSVILPDLVRGMSATATILAGTWRGVVLLRICALILSFKASSSAVPSRRRTNRTTRTSCCQS